MSNCARPWGRIAAAWAVHALTASGAAWGLMALAAISQERWKAAFAWMGLTIAIDAVDGALARLARVDLYAARVQGDLLDNIVDYFTYVIVPACFLYRAGITPGWYGLAAGLAITAASAYQFSQTGAKTDDHFFLGFPSYWNIVLFYLFMFSLPEWANLLLILVLCLTVFVPIKYVYPSRTAPLRPLTLLLTTVWGAMVVGVLLRYPQQSPMLLYGSLVYVIYYLGLSLYFTVRRTAGSG
jgi:phosphatidylcholine synthase